MAFKGYQGRRAPNLNWSMETSEDEIRSKIIEKYFTVNASFQRLDRFRLKFGHYPADDAREFISHALNLWRSSAPLVGENQDKFDTVIHSNTNLGVKLSYGIKCFYEISELLKKKGILHIKKRATSTARSAGGTSGAGVSWP